MRSRERFINNWPQAQVFPDCQGCPKVRAGPGAPCLRHCRTHRRVSGPGTVRGGDPGRLGGRHWDPGGFHRRPWRQAQHRVPQLRERGLVLQDGESGPRRTHTAQPVASRGRVQRGRCCQAGSSSGGFQFARWRLSAWRLTQSGAPGRRCFLADQRGVSDSPCAVPFGPGGRRDDHWGIFADSAAPQFLDRPR